MCLLRDALNTGTYLLWFARVNKITDGKCNKTSQGE